MAPGTRIITALQCISKLRMYTPVCQFSIPTKTVCHSWLLLRLSVTSWFLLRLLSAKTWLPAETIQLLCFLPSLGKKQNHTDRLDRKQEVRDHGHSQRKPNIMDSLSKKGKLANQFMPCENPFLRMIMTD